MQIKFQKFDAFSPNELYNMLELRAAVFVVEQDCVYNDLDHYDQKATHLLAYNNHTLIGTARIFKPGDKYQEASFGRIAILEKERGKGLGHQIMKEIHTFAKRTFGSVPIKIEAQCYLINFYEQHGYKTVGKSYLLDGIDHVIMTTTLT